MKIAFDISQDQKRRWADKRKKEGGWRDFLLHSVTKNPAGYTLNLVTYAKEPEAFPVTFEDRLRQVYQARSIRIAQHGFIVKKVLRAAFVATAKQWEAALDKNLGYSIGDVSDPKGYASDILILARQMRASDVHLEPDSKDEKVPPR